MDFPSTPNQNDDDTLYTPLHPNEIRLLKLLPGPWGMPICCELSHVPLSNKPAYKALSYAWGSRRLVEPVFLNETPRLVTKNLYTALSRLRSENEPVTIWVDALCIDQANIDERATQVAMMRSIFAKTDEVIVHLDIPNQHLRNHRRLSRTPRPESFFRMSDSDDALLEKFMGRFKVSGDGCLRSQRSQVDVGTQVFCLIRLVASGRLHELISAVADHPDGSLPSMLSDLFENLRYMLRCRWWNRVWIIQEVVVPERVMVFYGGAIAPWDMLVSAAKAWLPDDSRNSDPPSIPREYSLVLDYFAKQILGIEKMRRQWRFTNQTTLLRLLRQFSDREASDDRDKVYALLGLVTQSLSLPNGHILLPDYSLDIKSVFINASLSIVRTTRSLSVIVVDSARKYRQDLPSWAADWTAPADDAERKRAEKIERYDATGCWDVQVQHDTEEEYGGIAAKIDGMGQKHSLEQATGIKYATTVSDFTAILGHAQWKEYLLLPESTREDCLEAIETYEMAKGGTVWARLLDQSILQVPGVQIDRVAKVSEACFSDLEFPAVVKEWAVLALSNHHEWGSVATWLADFVYPFLHTLGINVSEENSPPIQGPSQSDLGWLVPMEDSETLPRCISDALLAASGRPRPYAPMKEHRGVEPALADERAEEQLLKVAIEQSYRRRFFVTATGHFGLGPLNLQAADRIYLLPGSKTPVVLRDAGKRETARFKGMGKLGTVERECHEIIGDCYIHPYMQGQARERFQSAAAQWGSKSDLRRCIAAFGSAAKQRRDLEIQLFRLGTRKLQLSSLLEDLEKQFEKDEAFPETFLMNRIKSADIVPEMERRQGQIPSSELVPQILRERLVEVEENNSKTERAFNSAVGQAEATKKSLLAAEKKSSSSIFVYLV